MNRERAQYAQVLKQAGASGVRVKWLKGHIGYVSSEKGRQPSTRVDIIDGTAVCGCEVASEGRLYVHAAVVLRESPRPGTVRLWAVLH